MSFKVEEIPTPKTVLAESPHWDEASQSLFFIEHGGKQALIFRYDYKENTTYSAKIEGELSVTFVIPVADETDKYALGLGSRVGVIQWDGVSSHTELLYIAFEVDKNTNFNDCKADPAGRFYGGTMASDSILFEAAAGSFYRHVKGEGTTELLRNIYISNGLAWNEELNKFYYVDSGQLDIKEFDYNPINGDISNERVAIDFRVNGKVPGFCADGMTIDTEGFLYVACFGKSKVLKVDPKNGKILLEIPIPTEGVSSVTFGGPNLDILYVTTASMRVSVPKFEITCDGKSPLAGRVFKVTGLGSKGYPGVKVRVSKLINKISKM